jgi:ribosomal protein S18 acetylase RimI-like enzyme
MASLLSFRNASSLSLDQLATAFNTGFEGYFHPMQMTAEILSRKVRMEHLDLQHSLLADIGNEFVGFALLGLRGREAWCGGFGIAPKFRNRGLATQVMSEFIARARVCGVTELRLEVLTKNTHAIRLYERAGMHITRDLLILERTKSAKSKTPVRVHELQEAEPAALLGHFRRLHAWRPAWQREFASLLSADGIHALCLGGKEKPNAYALVFTRPDGITQILDLAATNAKHAEALSAELIGRFDAMRVVNEPEESFFVAALIRNGFSEVERQHEMACVIGSQSL